MKLVYEVNGSDVAITEMKDWNDLLEGAKWMAERHEVPLSDVSLRFVEG